MLSIRPPRDLETGTHLVSDDPEGNETGYTYDRLGRLRTETEMQKNAKE